MRKTLSAALLGLFLAPGLSAQWADGSYTLTDTFNNRPASAVASTLPHSGAHLLAVTFMPDPAPADPRTITLGWDGTQYIAVADKNHKRFRTQTVGNKNYWWLEESNDSGQTWSTLASGTY